MNETNLTKCILKNIEIISSNAPLNFNFKKRELILNKNMTCFILYIDGLANKEDIKGHIIDPLLFKIDCNIQTLESPAEYISKRFITIDDIQLCSNAETISNALKSGKSIILIENDDNAIICNTSISNLKMDTEVKLEENVLGEKSVFGDNINFNISLIQEKLKNDNLKIEKYILGEENNCDVCLIYMENKIDSEILKNLKDNLKNIKAPYIPDTGYIAQYIQKTSMYIFPKIKITEAPNKVISDIIQGKAAIFVNGNAYAAILPVVFWEFFQGFEDYSNGAIIGNFARLIRFLAAIIILTASPIYFTLINYNVYLLPLSLIKIISSSRNNIPYPPIMEILFMEIMVEFIREGSLRLPSKIAQTSSIIGGIILGEAVVKAGLVSPATLVVVAVTVISTFMIPNYEMSLKIRLLRFYMLLLSVIFGFFGIILGLFTILAYLIYLDSFGIPYFSPLAPLKTGDLKDAIIRYQLKYLNNVPITFAGRRRKKGKNEK